MIRYSASYIHGDKNFVIQNSPEKYILPHKRDAAISVLKNLLQRGNPTKLSHYLQTQLDCESGYQSKAVYLNSKEGQNWHKTIKGDEENGKVPAYDFYYKDLVKDLGKKYSFIQPLIIPECKILDITKDHTYKSQSFTNRQVDFYLPQAKLVIEIDGYQHEEPNIKEQDTRRDAYLKSFGVLTVRIKTEDYYRKNKKYYEKMNQIIQQIDNHWETVRPYQDAYETFCITDEVKAVAIMRWQLTLLSLIESHQLSLKDKQWAFIIKDHEASHVFELAVNDLFLWLKHLYKLLKEPFTPPKVHVEYVTDFKTKQDQAVYLDFSLRKRWTDENERETEVIFIDLGREDTFLKCVSTRWVMNCLF